MLRSSNQPVWGRQSCLPPPFRRLLLLFAIAALLSGESADWILTARHVVTMDSSRRVIENGAVAVQGDRIAAVGARDEIEKRFQAKQRLDAGEAILTPGLINTHGHAPMVLFRGIADDLRLQEWLEKFIFPAEAKNVGPDFVRAGTRLACLEMLLSGTTTYADMYYFEEIIAEATAECGMRGVLGQTVIQFRVADAKTPAEALARAEAFIKKFSKHPMITPAVAPHAVYTNSDETLRSARELANRYGVPMLIHVSETRKENDDLAGKRNVSPTQLLERLGALNGRTLAAHGVWVSDADIRTLVDRNAGIAHCPSSNMKLASGVAPVMKYLRAGARLGLGTDGPAGSNNDLNIFEEMDLAAKLQKVHTSDPTALTAAQAVEMATIGGARALGMEKEIGSLEAGKRADLVVIRADAPHAVPMYDVYSHLVYALKASDVRHVMVNGRLIVRDRNVLTLQQTEVLAEAMKWQKKIAASIRN
jgi:5-methylthioadenosine/S-adenosylhomocysteine deaminase